MTFDVAALVRRLEEMLLRRPGTPTASGDDDVLDEVTRQLLLDVVAESAGSPRLERHLEVAKEAKAQAKAAKDAAQSRRRSGRRELVCHRRRRQPMRLRRCSRRRGATSGCCRWKRRAAVTRRAGNALCVLVNQ